MYCLCVTVLISGSSDECIVYMLLTFVVMSVLFVCYRVWW